MSYKENKEVGKILKAPGQGVSEPFYQEETIEEKKI